MRLAAERQIDQQFFEFGISQQGLLDLSASRRWSQVIADDNDAFGCAFFMYRYFDQIRDFDG
jgi:hypothetical protein